MTPFDREIVARTLFGEARGEAREGMRAVGHVVFNRFKAAKWYSGKTLAGTACKRMQFSCWNEADKNRQQLFELPDDDPTLNLARSLVDDINNGDADPTFGATHYHATTIAPPTWTAGAQFIVQIGKHRFFKGVV